MKRSYSLPWHYVAGALAMVLPFVPHRLNNEYDGENTPAPQYKQPFISSEASDWSALITFSEGKAEFFVRGDETSATIECVRAKIRLKDTGKKRTKGRGKNMHEIPIFTSTLHFHHLRHTCLSWLGDTGASDMILKAIAGHSNSNVTDRYVHVSILAMRNAVEALERAMLHPAETAHSVEAEVG